MNHAFATLLLTALLLIAASPAAYAQDKPPSPHDVIFTDGTGTLTEIAGTAGLEKSANPAATLGAIILWLLSFIALLAMLAIVWGGTMYVLSFGNEARAALGKRIIVVALVGLAIALLSYVIIVTVQNLVKIV